MEVFYSLFFFLFGAVFGSFYNVVGLRSPRGETFTTDRSYCPYCKKTLHWYELIPIVSYLMQFGKCRKCQSSISPLYPIIECSTGALFLISFWNFGFDWELFTAVLFVSMLMIILVSDIRYMIIENKILFFFLPLFIIMRIISPLTPWWSPIIGAVLVSVLLALIIIVSRGGMGAGDMKLFFVLGIVLGADKVILAFFLAAFLGAVIGILLIAFKWIERKQPVPFGPYIVVGAFIAYFYGDAIISWYMGLL
ncbi:prepilin peptidase [Oceanobacillus timonensis]|uniref:prepilin peptidase n=1 Tax=Oceanobacillus timonensis TaxID=1926285 RepID=UPI0009BA30E0|nr:A24 family peptidase [Oceanobacillus timonensis]